MGTSFRSLSRKTVGLFAGLLASGLSALAGAAEPQRVALVVGISDYPDESALADLPNPVNDARLIAGTLEKAGFQVTEALDVTRGQLKSQIDGFVDGIQPGADAVVYFAGHGMQYEGKNYLLAANATLLRKYDLGEESIQAETLLDAVAEKQPGAALVFLDCCRTPPTKSWLASRGREAVPGGLAAIQSTDLLIHFAAAPGKPALDGEGSNSPYAAALARHMLEGKELAEMLRDVANEVLRTTDQEQRPFQTGSLLKPFVFAKQQPVAPLADPSARPVRVPSPSPSPSANMLPTVAASPGGGRVTGIVGNQMVVTGIAGHSFRTGESLVLRRDGVSIARGFVKRVLGNGDAELMLYPQSKSHEPREGDAVSLP